MPFPLPFITAANVISVVSGLIRVIREGLNLGDKFSDALASLALIIDSFTQTWDRQFLMFDSIVTQVSLVTQAGIDESLDLKKISRGNTPFFLSQPKLENWIFISQSVVEFKILKKTFSYSSKSEMLKKSDFSSF